MLVNMQTITNLFGTNLSNPKDYLVRDCLMDETSKTGLYSNTFRHYAPEVGWFTHQDPKHVVFEKITKPGEVYHLDYNSSVKTYI